MVKIVMVSFVVLGLALSVDAIGLVGRSRGHSPHAQRINEGGVYDHKKKNAAEREVREKAKKITIEKLEFPKDAKHSGVPIDMSSRIESLCGYEIGSIAKVPRHPKLDQNGNIVMTEKLKVPFRTCTQVELTYSKVNHALYSISVFSPAQKKMSDEAAWAEVEAMADAIKAKFGKKVGALQKCNMASSKTITSNMNIFSFQSLSIMARPSTIEKRGELKGGGSSSESGWVFSVSLTDRAMRDFKVEEPKPKSNEVSAQDVNAL